jgi:hypothetical protein
MENKFIHETTVVFQHEISLDEFSEILQYGEEHIKSMLDTMVYEIFKLRETEAEVNEHGTKAFCRIKEVSR